MRVSVRDCERAALPIVEMLNKKHINKPYVYDYDSTMGVVRRDKPGGGIAVVIPNNGRNDYNTELMFNNIAAFVKEMNKVR